MPHEKGAIMVIKIEDTRKEFRTVDQGEVIRWGTDYYMKMREIEDYEGNKINAVHLMTGETTHINDGTKVMNVNASLNVERGNE